MKQKKITPIESGFTLIELLVVISIIGILSAIMFAGFSGIQQKSRDGQRKSDLRQIQAALEQYRADKGKYPIFGKIETGGCNSTAGWNLVSDISCSLNPSGGPLYMAQIPSDPTSGDACPGYLYASDGTSYTLFTILENVNDPSTGQKPSPAYPPSGNCNTGCQTFTVSAPTCSGSTYNYWVNNP